MQGVYPLKQNFVGVVFVFLHLLLMIHFLFITSFILLVHYLVSFLVQFVKSMVKYKLKYLNFNEKNSIYFTSAYIYVRKYFCD